MWDNKLNPQDFHGPWVSTQLRVGLGSIILLDELGLISFLYFGVGVEWISKLLYLSMGESGLDSLPLAGLCAGWPKSEMQAGQGVRTVRPPLTSGTD
jgi:hypothetical protein